NPEYENITLAFRNQDQPRGSHSPPKNRAKQPPASPHPTASGGAHVPAWSRPSPDSAQVPRWLHRVILSLYVLFALSCIILIALVLVKSEGRRAALLQTRLLLASVSISGQECQEQQKRAWGGVQRLIKEVKQEIETVKRNVNTGNEIVMTSLPDISQIKSKLQEISKVLERLSL
ncbi:TPPC5 protein, partial [Crocuta crocuta]